ncbi:MAG: ATP-binding protein [Azoarcus sp.]|nr:ATP-binding protein [Azoarcus sp.]
MILDVGDIESTLKGYERLAQFAAKMGDCAFEKICLDFSACDWFDANMSAPLGVVLAHATDGFNDISIKDMHKGTEEILARNGFLTSYGYAPRKDNFGTTIPYRRLNADDERYFTTYVSQHLKRQKIPAMTEALSRRFKGSIMEVFINAAAHSETELGIFACGQYFPKKERLDFSIADAGIGIRKKIAKELGLKMNSDKAIEWALRKGNTVRKGKIPGGLGLKLLKEFVTLNEGRLQIISDRGYWEMNGRKETLTRMGCSFPGTVVNIEINTADTKSYRLLSEDN